MKKILCFLLCAILLFTAFPTVLTASASSDDKDTIFLQCFDNHDLECTVLILTFDESFTEISDSVAVELTVNKETSKIEEDNLIREIHRSGAQLFIRLPSYLSDKKGSTIPTSSTLTVKEGAFLSADSEPSPAFSGILSVSDSVSRSTKDFEIIKKVSGAKTQIHESYTLQGSAFPIDFPISSESKSKKNKIVEGTEMHYTSVNWSWTADEMTFTQNGEQTEKVITANTLGEHTVLGKVNDFVYDTLSYTVVTKDQARKDSLRILFGQTLRSFYVVPIGLIIFFTIPGMFMLAGQFMQIEAFFKQLTSKELIEDYRNVTIR